jgi:hypothetical protein
MIRDYRDRPSETGDLRRRVDDIVNRHDRDPSLVAAGRRWASASGSRGCAARGCDAGRMATEPEIDRR